MTKCSNVCANTCILFSLSSTETSHQMGGWDPRGIYRVGSLTLGNVASARVAQRAQIAAEAAGIPVAAAAAGAPPAVDAEVVDADGVAAGPVDPAAAAEPSLPIPPAAAAADAGPGQEGAPGAEGAGGVL